MRTTPLWEALATRRRASLDGDEGGGDDGSGNQITPSRRPRAAVTSSIVVRSPPDPYADPYTAPHCLSSLLLLSLVPLSLVLSLAPLSLVLSLSLLSLLLLAGGVSLSWPSGESCGAKLNFVVSFPLVAAMKCTIPDVRREGNAKYCYFSFLMSISWIGVFSYPMVRWSEIIGDTVGIPNVVMGLTFIAVRASQRAPRGNDTTTWGRARSQQRLPRRRE